MTRHFCIDRAKKRLGYKPLVWLEQGPRVAMQDSEKEKKEYLRSCTYGISITLNWGTLPLLNKSRLPQSLPNPLHPTTLSYHRTTPKNLPLTSSSITNKNPGTNAEATLRSPKLTPSLPTNHSFPSKPFSRHARARSRPLNAVSSFTESNSARPIRQSTSGIMHASISFAEKLIHCRMCAR